MSRPKSFIQGAAILAVAGAVSKALGALYRIPLARWIGADGIGLYQIVYPIYTTILALAAAGVPIAISIMISRKITEGFKGDAEKIFRTSLVVIGCIGAVLSLLLIVFSGFVANTVLGDPEARIPIVAVAPAIFISGLMAVYRGYFQGHQNMTPTAISQVIEQLFRVTAIIILALLLLHMYKDEITYAVSGATAGAAIGGIGGLAVLLYFYIKSRDKREKYREARLISADSSADIAKELIRLAIPVSIGAVVLPLVQMLDAIIVPSRLVQLDVAYLLSQYPDLAQTVDPGNAREVARGLYGYLSGMAAVLISLPTIFTISISTSMVPSISEADAQGKMDLLKERINYGMRAGMVIALPCTAGLFALAIPICDLLYKAPEAGIPLMPLAFSTITLAAFQLSSAGLQGIGRPEIGMRNLVITGALKVLFNYTLTAIPALNIVGAAIGTVLAFLVGSLLNLWFLQRLTGVSYEWKRFVKIFMICVLMGAIAMFSYIGMESIDLPKKLATIVAMVLGVGVYGGLMVAVKELDMDMLKAIRGSGASGEVG